MTPTPPTFVLHPHDHDPDGDIVITVFPGSPHEVDVHIEQDPESPVVVTEEDVTFDPATGELTVKVGGRVQHHNLSFLVPR